MANHSNHSWRKLSPEHMQEILALKPTIKYGDRVLIAKKYNVSPSLITNILKHGRRTKVRQEFLDGV